MPSHFDRFRLLDSSVIRNESQKILYMGPSDDGPFIEVLPGEEQALPASADRVVVIKVLRDGPAG